ncbi:tetratricopeptide repeat protein [Desulfocapsa sulfexigens DSM 10523]|uniref:Tetratricopeptide repeat protein n=1 Tax=Desulfocapsa sulfexigens (strain DSM 10523 / SB164P1) TaxID=1167006 RepID=M1P6F7_DESSD|nr:tetratricopeptide repeat protein [Desulfocapsa sulfexigens]AGF77302.1 tetratricopeptide repeat protein [Desulfocapsa sulfexigens DSM 10523]
MKYLRVIPPLSWLMLFFTLFPAHPLFANSQTSPFFLPPKTSEASSPSATTGGSPFLLPPEENIAPPLNQVSLTAGELQKQGTRLAREGKLEEARISLSRSLKKDPTSLVTLNNLGLVMRKLERFDEALQAYISALESDKNYALTYKNLGILLEKQGVHDQAALAYKKYCVLAPNAADAHNVGARADWLQSQINTSPTQSTTQQKAEEEQELSDQYMAEKALEWHDIGANLFAESVVEKDRDKLFSAIDYLEKATVGLPENNGITVDLADAYMEVNSPSLTALAIDLYESVFESFSEDPLLARLVEAYYQLRNFEVAFALAEQRMTSCPVDQRRAAAIQLSFVAFSSQKETRAIELIRQDIQQRGDDHVLALTIATIQEAQGETDAALSIAFSLLADKNLDSALRAYVEKVKTRLLGGVK